jgi:selenocysteine lyase/cysteine desulfurase
MTEDRSRRELQSALPSESHADRRRFLGIAAGALPALLWPEALAALAEQLRPANSQDVWNVVRDAFLIPEDRIYLNVGTLGPQPRVVVDAVMEHTRRVAMTFPPGIDWDSLKSRLATLVNGDAAGFVFPRNTTEGMSFVANGIDFRSGDEILTTDHEHIGGLCPWQLVSKRYSLTLRQLPLPVPAPSHEEIAGLFRRAISARTRVISVSHVNFTTGLIMPVRELAQLCRERNLIFVIDGAHPPGLMPVDLAGIQPDFYASSPHKWLLAPQGTGFLWMRQDWRTRLWPTLASGGWDDLSLGAHRFNHLGTFDESRLAGLDAALRFHHTIGSDRIHARIRELRARLASGLLQNPRVRMMSPQDDDRVAGMVSFKLDGIDSLELQRRLAQIDAGGGRQLRIRTRVIGEYDYGWMRLSPHIYNTSAEIDQTIRMIEVAAQDG